MAVELFRSATRDGSSLGRDSIVDIGVEQSRELLRDGPRLGEETAIDERGERPREGNGLALHALLDEGHPALAGRVARVVQEEFFVLGGLTLYFRFSAGALALSSPSSVPNRPGSPSIAHLGASVGIVPSGATCTIAEGSGLSCSTGRFRIPSSPPMRRALPPVLVFSVATACSSGSRAPGAITVGGQPHCRSLSGPSNHAKLITAPRWARPDAPGLRRRTPSRARLPAHRPPGPSPRRRGRCRVDASRW
jgi:hypothetical protein